MIAWLFAAALLLDPDPPRAPLPDVALVDQHGQPVRLEADLIGDGVVVVNAFFTSCPTTCPRVARRLAEVQGLLGPRFGRDVRFLSVTVDPERDTPRRLLSWATRYSARPGWRFVTGEPEALELVLGELGYATPDPEQHSAILLVVDRGAGTWRRADGLGRPRDILRVIEGVLAER